jgi:peptide/nickel transport system substrate-binding protein
MFKKVVFVALLALLVLSLPSMRSTQAQDDKPRGGTVTVNESPRGSWVRNFNPYAPDPMHGTTRILYEPLVVFNPVEGGAPTYWLATEYAYSEDLLSLTYKLREGVKFSDGEDFNADDVVFTFNMIKEFPGLDRWGILSFTDSVEKIDDYTVTFHLSMVYTQADTVIGHRLYIVPEHVWSQIEDPVTFTNPDPVTTGPFVLSEFSEQVYTLCRNEYYWQAPKPYVDCLRYPAYSGNDAANLALINGEVDWAGNFVPDIEAVYVQRDPEHNHYYFWGGNGPWSFYTNITKAPFDDVRLRQAMSMAIDYELIRDTAMNGYTVVEQENAVGIWPRYQNWVSQEAVDKVKEMGLGVYNPEAAAALLDEAGYAVGDDGWRTAPDGSTIDFTIQIVNGWTDVVTAAQIISQNFQDVGLNAKVVTPDFGQWLNNLQYGTYDTSLAWTVWDRTPWDFFRNIMDEALVLEDGQLTGQYMPGWFSDETTQLLADFTSTADEAAQMEIIGKLQLALVENVLLSPLSPWPSWYEYSTLRFEGWPTEENYYTQGSPWHDDAARIVAINIYPVEE